MAVSVAVEAKPEVEIWRRPKKINFLTLASYSLLQTVFCHNTKRHRRQTDRQTDRQTTHSTKGATDSTVGQKNVKSCFFEI